MANTKILEEIIYPEIEPGVINRAMIIAAIQDQSYPGEAGRLQRSQTIDFDNCEYLRLEFKNILRIDHLWILPNLVKLSLNFNKLEKIENLEMLIHLKELDLSFNYIEKIENLSKLKLLETLSLYNNLITEIENLDELENLIILSIGNNAINTTTGIERLRFLKKLRVLNLEGNPISSNNSNFRSYIGAFLPQVKYYEYTYIKDEERESGKETFRRELRETENQEQDEIEMREMKANEIADEIRLSDSFVERLNEHQLFDSFYALDKNGQSLLQTDCKKIEELTREYRNDIHELSQAIYKLGLERYEERQKEIEMFQQCLDDGQERISLDGRRIIEEFTTFKSEVFADGRDLFRQIEIFMNDSFNEHPTEIEDCYGDIGKLNEVYFNYLDQMWQNLLEAELNLNESVENCILEFERNINKMINTFIEEAQVYFIKMKDVCQTHSKNILEEISIYITEKVVEDRNSDIPEDLQHLIGNRKAMNQLVEGMKKYHLNKIKEREDKLITRAKTWAKQLIVEIRKEYIEGNRTKINEINYFVDEMKESFHKIQGEVAVEVRKELSTDVI